jgi:protease-4
MRKHPVLLGIVLLLGVGVVLAALSLALGVIQKGQGGLSITDRIGVVPVEGIISQSDEIIEQLNGFADDDTVRAVVLRVESPGGGVAPSQEIYRAVRELRKKKKVVASLGSVAASGGYLVAVAADRIVANPGTLTGSISAVMHFADLQELMKKIGIRSAVVKSGKFKDIGSPAREMTDEEKALLQGIVDDIYDQFVATVAEGRQIPRASVEGLADGRIFTGRQALQLKLVDELGGLQEAVLLAGRLAGLSGKPQVVFAEKEKPSLWKFLLENLATSLVSELKEILPGQSQGAQYLLP